MNINKLKKEVHGILIKTDKYKCKFCGGVGVVNKHVAVKGLRDTCVKKDCKTCNGSGVHADTSKLLMDIISQLVFALNAWEDEKRADTFCLSDVINNMKEGKDLFWFSGQILNTHEDRLSHAFILLLDFAEYKGITIKKYDEINIDYNNIHNTITEIISSVANSNGLEEFAIEYLSTCNAINMILTLCKQQNIDLEKHVQARIEYMRGEV